MIFLVLVFLLGGLWKTEAEAETGVIGKEVTIRCSHSWASTNVKYFCKGACHSEDVLISSSKKKAHSNEKYSIRDEGNTFTVTISSLTQDDSGTYWCGIERAGVDTFSQVVLSVKADPQSKSNASSFNKLVYIGAGLGVVLLVLSVLLSVFFRYRNRGIHAFPGMNHDVVHGKQNKDDLTSSSPADDEVQAAGLLYATVSFSKPSEDSRDARGAEQLTYSSIKLRATDASQCLHTTPQPGDQILQLCTQHNPLKAVTFSIQQPLRLVVADVTVVVVVCPALLLIVVLLFIVCKHRPTKGRGGSSEQRRDDAHDTEDHPGDPQYEEIQMLDQQTRSVYATVNHPSDQLHYASVTILQHSALVPTEEGGGDTS
ncbi:uncharacterized protein LOC119217406 [Pungitius pungitius]|uniref:uncharacterized protein LOC119217406 n=1 Tax=Pungitius pungitius TaxID=134920 RepID=UPI002E109F5A